MTDQISPNYLTIGADGEIGADFTGLINARGLIIPAAVSTPPALDQSVRWETTDGEVVTQLYAFADGSSSEFHAQAWATNSLTESSASIAALDSIGNPQARLECTYTDGFPFDDQVTAEAAGYVAKVLGGDGSSSFVQNSAGAMTQRMGDPATYYLGGGPYNYGPGTGNPWTLNPTRYVDPGNRLSGGYYYARNTGYYLVTAQVSFSCNISVATELAIVTNSGGSALGVELVTPATFGSFVSCSLIVPCNGGNYIYPRFAVTQAVQVLYTTSINGIGATNYSVMQVA